MSRFTLAPGVRADLRDIWRHIAVESHNLDAADRMIDRIAEALELLARQPFLGEARDDLAPGLRGFVVTPYVVLYSPREYGIRVIQIVHSARDIRTAFRRQQES